MKKGDIVYIYMGSPISAIQYKCIIIDVNIPYGFTSKDKYVMKIQLVRKYDKEDISYNVLKAFKTTFIRGPRHIGKDLSYYIHSLDEL